MTARVAALAIVGALWTAAPAEAQPLIWFNGFGLSAGGGGIRFGGESDDPITTFVRPHDDAIAAAALGAELRLGNRRWAVLLPEFHYLPASVDVTSATGTLTIGSRTITFEPESQSADTLAVLAGAQVGLVSSGRVWVRGGIGGGWITSSIASKDQNVQINVSTSDHQGLALSAGAGASIWTREVERKRHTIDVEVDYITVRTGGLHISAPSARVAWRFMYLPPP